MRRIMIFSAVVSLVLTVTPPFATADTQVWFFPPLTGLSDADTLAWAFTKAHFNTATNTWAADNTPDDAASNINGAKSEMNVPDAVKVHEVSSAHMNVDPVGNFPFAVASPLGVRRIYVRDAGSIIVNAIDVENPTDASFGSTITAETVDLPVEAAGNIPFAVATPSGTPRIYVRDTGSNTVKAVAMNGRQAAAVAEDLGMSVGAVYIAKSRVISCIRKIVATTDEP